MHQKKESNTIGSVVLDEQIIYQAGILIPHDLLMEFNLIVMDYQKKPEQFIERENNFAQFAGIILDHDNYDAAEQSKMQIFVRKAGILLLIHYIALKESFAHSWNKIKTLLRLNTYALSK